MRLIDEWPDWAHWAAVVVGAAGSGKSHLANVWRHRSNAISVKAQELNEESVRTFPSHQALCVEDLDEGIGDATALFHLLNLAREHKLSILCTSKVAPGELEIALPDLRSRLRALPLVEIEPADEPLLRAVLVKLFADRQLAVDPQLIAYLAVRTERSLDAVTRLVGEIDRLALSRRRKVTRSLAHEALESLFGPKDSS